MGGARLDPSYHIMPKKIAIMLCSYAQEFMLLCSLNIVIVLQRNAIMLTASAVVHIV